MSSKKLFPILLLAAVAIVSIHCIAQPPEAAPATQPAKAQTQPACPMMMGGHGGPMGPMCPMMGKFGPRQGGSKMGENMGRHHFMGGPEQVKELLSDPESVGLLAIKAIADEEKLSSLEKCKHMEGLLEDTASLIFRNALHLALKDLYKQQGDINESIEHLKTLLKENDDALQMQDEDDGDDMDDDDGEHAAREHNEQDMGGHDGHDGHDKAKEAGPEKGPAKGKDKDKDDEK